MTLEICKTRHRAADLLGARTECDAARRLIDDVFGREHPAARELEQVRSELAAASTGS